MLAQAVADDYTQELNQRYAPHADWQDMLEIEQVEAAASKAWWRSPAAIRSARSGLDLPLSGLHLALDPGHIGGMWAAIEGRNFKINAADFAVREGELVLEVARLVRAELIRMGAAVTLLRDGTTPLNPKPLQAYFSTAVERIDPPRELSWSAWSNYSLALRDLMHRLHAISGELLERARIVNEDIQPDALISLHINAAPWPTDDAGNKKFELVESNHTHVLIFGCLSDAELSVPLQRQQLIAKLVNGSGVIERELGEALAISLKQATELPPSNYRGTNATRLVGGTPYLYARNLLLLRAVECPVVLLEPYIANSRGTYPRLQQAIRSRHSGHPPAADDILTEYADAVVRGLLAVYAPPEVDRPAGP